MSGVHVLHVIRAALGATTLLLAIVVPSAAAATPDAATPVGVGVVEAPMYLDCGALRGQVRKYAVDHAYCPAAGRTSGDVTPQNTVYGNCGSSFIYIEDPNWTSSTARFRYGFSSSKGIVVSRNLAVGYSGARGPGGFSDSGFMASTSYSHTSGERTTGSGYLYATLGGTVTLFWGASCTLLQPTDGEYIN
ncbi:hypothetical protein [Phycicoccus sonneratiae]|uniref:Peptidase inhibitor family I36 n=1 Tax=Phycicoccus sonneratiae TaxID=2807628 RepID=A0ABS2CKU6_9MICO|nr:hypothetical protein [Phycicoccus sonneraticus]MBM6400448.1 hypothetical protein [Phycicoccus sonneraticus]